MQFERACFTYFGGYLNYLMPDGTRQFIARFKHDPKDKPTFLTFLIKNFSVEEYVERLVNREEAPLNILASKGYKSHNQRKAARYKELAAMFRGETKAA